MVSKVDVLSLGDVWLLYRWDCCPASLPWEEKPSPGAEQAIAILQSVTRWPTLFARLLTWSSHDRQSLGLALLNSDMNSCSLTLALSPRAKEQEF